MRFSSFFCSLVACILCSSYFLLVYLLKKNVDHLEGEKEKNL